MSIRKLVLAGFVLIALVFPAVATSAPMSSTISLRLVNVASNHKVPVLKKVWIKGRLLPAPTPGQYVKVVLLRNQKTYQAKTIHVDGTDGRFETTFKKIIPDGRYRVLATHEASPELDESHILSSRFRVRFPSLHQGSHGPKVRLFNRLLRSEGYIAGGSSYTAKTGRGVMAFRKVNRMARIFSFAGRNIFRKLSVGQGKYHVKHPDLGRHVEVSISRQILVEAIGGRVRRVYHVSTGKPSTPTVRGLFHFYMRQPGFNSHGMFDSFYFHNGYAVHGYAEVPTFAASHGCVRTPIPDQPAIYDWLQQGMPIIIS